MVPLGIDVGCNVMCHLARVVAKADPTIKGHSTKPYGPAFIS